MADHAAGKKQETRPDLYHSVFWKIDFKNLAKRGINYLIIDVDGTIAATNSCVVEPRAKDALLKAISEKTIKGACLLSNTVYGKKREKRVADMAREIGIPYIAARLLHQKPHYKPFLRAIEMMDASPDETAVIGDQIFTDIVGGNRLGLFTILIKPLGGSHLFSVLLLRRLRENMLLKKMGVSLDD